MKKSELLEKIIKGNYDKDTLLSWVRCLPVDMESRKPLTNKVGDVYMHPVFKHPYILLKKRKGYWICSLLTSNGSNPEVLEECESRFFQNKFITKTLFTASEIQGSFMNTFENLKQVNRVYKEIMNCLK